MTDDNKTIFNEIKELDNAYDMLTDDEKNCVNYISQGILLARTIYGELTPAQ